MCASGYLAEPRGPAQPIYLVLLRQVVATSKPSTEETFETEERVLGTSLRVLSRRHPPPPPPDLGDRFDVGVPVCEDGIAGDNSVPSPRHDESSTTRPRGGVDTVGVVATVGGQPQDLFGDPVHQPRQSHSVGNGSVREGGDEYSTGLGHTDVQLPSAPLSLPDDPKASGVDNQVYGLGPRQPMQLHSKAAGAPRQSSAVWGLRVEAQERGDGGKQPRRLPPGQTEQQTQGQRGFAGHVGVPPRPATETVPVWLLDRAGELRTLGTTTTIAPRSLHQRPRTSSFGAMQQRLASPRPTQGAGARDGCSGVGGLASGGSWGAGRRRRTGRLGRARLRWGTGGWVPRPSRWPAWPPSPG